MAEPISIPINLTTGTLQGIEAAQRAIEATRRQMTTLQGWEALPGGGIRRTTTASGVLPTPGAGIYAPPTMAAPQATAAAVQQSTRVVQQHAIAVQQATTATQAFFQTHTQAQQRQTLQSTQLRMQGIQQLLSQQATPNPQLQARLAGLTQWSQTLQAALGAPVAPPGGGPPGGGPPGGGPPGGGPPGGGGFLPMVGGALARGWDSIRRTAGGVLGAVAGIGIYQTITSAMEAYQQRARGVIDTGMQLNLSFDQVGATVDAVRQKYQFLAHDVLAAIQVTQRLSGRTVTAQTLMPTATMATAYGIPLPQMAEMQELARRYTGGVNPMATMLGLGRRVGPGITPMGPGALMEEGLSMAQIGAATSIQAPPEFYGRMQGLIGGLGDIYQVPGAQAAAFGRFQQGLSQTGNEAVLAVRMRAIAQLREQRRAQGLGTTLTLGTGPNAPRADLSTIHGMEMAAETAATNPELIQGYYQAFEALTRDRPAMRPQTFFDVVMGGRGSRAEAQRWLQRIEREGPGVLTQLDAPGGDRTAAEEQTQAERVRRRAERPEVTKFLEVVAEREAGLERLGEPLTRISMNLQQAMIGLFDTFDKGTINIGKLTEAFGKLDESTRAVVGTLMLLGSPGLAGQLAGAGLLGSAAVGSGLVPNPESSAPFENPVLLPPGWNFLRPLQQGTPPTQPQRQGP